MNKLIATAVFAAGLTMLAAPAGAAHDELRYENPAAAHHQWRFYDRGKRIRHSQDRSGYRRGRHYQRDHRRGHYRYAGRGRMPRWLRLRGSFRYWYRRSLRRHDRYLTWNQLYDQYRWESSHHRHYRY